MPLATSTDIATRLGRALTAGEDAAAEMLIDAVQANIADAADCDSDWIAGLDPVPKLLRAICIEKVCVALANPQGLASMQEQLGQHSTSVRFRDDGLLLTDREERLVRGAVHGATSGSTRVESVIDEIHDNWYGS